MIGKRKQIAIDHKIFEQALSNLSDAALIDIGVTPGEIAFLIAPGDKRGV